MLLPLFFEPFVLLDDLDLDLGLDLDLDLDLDFELEVLLDFDVELEELELELLDDLLLELFDFESELEPNSRTQNTLSAKSTCSLVNENVSITSTRSNCSNIPFHSQGLA